MLIRLDTAQFIHTSSALHAPAVNDLRDISVQPLNGCTVCY